MGRGLEVKSMQECCDYVLRVMNAVAGNNTETAFIRKDTDGDYILVSTVKPQELRVPKGYKLKVECFEEDYLYVNVTEAISKKVYSFWVYDKP